jgi:hypothetical protein
MTWDDILLETRPSEDALRRALAQIFGVSPGQIGLVRSSAASTGSARVRGVMADVRGDFRCLLSVAIDDALAGADRATGVRRLCVALGTRAFISDGTSNPYSGVLIDETGGVQRAQLDPDAEERDEYRLWKGGQM